MKPCLGYTQTEGGQQWLIVQSLERLNRRSHPYLMSKETKYVWRWARRARADHENDWRDRLACLGPLNLAVHGKPGSKMIGLESFSSSAAPLRRLAREFGGKVERIDMEKLAEQANAPRRPLQLAGDLVILDVHGEWPAEKKKPKNLLRITGAMAFGTGEHPTTSACLRLLRAEAALLIPGWSALDLGTGSGILAIAAEKLGAGRVTAFDNDSHAVRTAEANARRNRCQKIRFSTCDLLSWQPAKNCYPIVMANVFSETLRSAAPSITGAVACGGCLILSGILRIQESETLQTFLQHNLQLEKTSRRGKWVTLQLRLK